MRRHVDTEFLFAPGLRGTLRWARYRFTSRWTNARRALARRWRETYRPTIATRAARTMASARTMQVGSTDADTSPSPQTMRDGITTTAGAPTLSTR